MARTFVTLFNVYNVHLTKDVGLIPYGMHEFCGYDAFIASYLNEDYVYLNSDVRGLKLWTIKKNTGNFLIDSLIFLAQNSRKIDVLNVYHICRRTYIQVFFYCIFNRDGHVYLKTDGQICRNNSHFWPLAFGCLKKCDLISTELEVSSQIMSKDWGLPIYAIGNPTQGKHVSIFRPYAKRQNIIITVGRINAPEKNNKLLVDAFSCVANQIPSWDLVLIGPCDDSFGEYIQMVMHERLLNEERIQLYGNVVDRVELNNLYQCSKVYVAASLHESFGISVLEAATNGTYIICSDIPAFKEITCNFAYADYFDSNNVTELQNHIIKCCTMQESELEQKALEERSYVLDKYNLEKICKDIDSHVSESI